jgi:hypothetical protein
MGAGWTARLTYGFKGYRLMEVKIFGHSGERRESSTRKTYFGFG